MKNKSQVDYEIAEYKANIKISRRINALHPVIVNIANNLADIDLIKFIRISRDYLKASSETTNGRVKIYTAPIFYWVKAIMANFLFNYLGRQFTT